MSRSSRKSASEKFLPADDANKRPLSGRKRLLFALIPAFTFLIGAEIATRSIGYPKQRAAGSEFDFPPPELIGKAFSRDSAFFWKLIPEYDGPWELYKNKYTCERNVSPAELEQRSHRFHGDEYYRSVTWNVNSEGFRGPADDRSKSTVLFVGSSVTFGWGVQAKDSFPALITKKLTGSGHNDWTTVNAGVPGYSSHQCKKTLDELLPRIRPRIVIVEVGINDGVLTPSVPDRDMQNLLEPKLASRIVTSSGLLSAIRTWTSGESSSIAIGPRPAPNERFYYTSMYLPDHVRVPEQHFRENIAAMESLAREEDIAIFFIFPGLYNEYGDNQLAKSVQFTHPHEVDVVEAIRAAAGSDPSACFLPYDEAHLSVKGHQIAAERIWERISDEDVLRSSK